MSGIVQKYHHYPQFVAQERRKLAPRAPRPFAMPDKDCFAAVFCSASAIISSIKNTGALVGRAGIQFKKSGHGTLPASGR